MPEKQQTQQGNASIQNPIAPSSRAESSPSNEVAHSRRRTIDRRSGQSTPQNQELNRRKEESERRKELKQHENAKELSEKEKALALIRARNEMKVQQFRKKKLLAGCEPVMGLNYDVLAMDDYPENALVAAAKRDRDYWLAIATVAGGLFLLGLAGFISAFLSGISAGICIASVAFAFTSLRKYFFDRPPLHELLAVRKAIEFKAISHIMFLEGTDGLAWRCGKMYKYNHNLARGMFNGVKKFSKEGSLKSVLMSRKHIRLYLLFMIEAQKAYKRLQKDYLNSHFEHMEQGWDDTVTEGEAERLAADLDIQEEGEA